MEESHAIRQDIAEIQGTLRTVVQNQERQTEMMEQLVRQEERIGRLERDMHSYGEKRVRVHERIDALAEKLAAVETRCAERAHIEDQVEELQKNLRVNDLDTARVSWGSQILGKVACFVGGSIVAVMVEKLFRR